MQKNYDPADSSSLLYYQTFGRKSSSCPTNDNLRIEEFGLSAREVLSEDILFKTIAYEKGNSSTTEVYLCYNWKQKNPFIVVKHRRDHVTRSYSPQYGHEDNYPESRWADTSLQFYSPSELSSREPEIAAILREL